MKPVTLKAKTLRKKAGRKLIDRLLAQGFAIRIQGR